MSDGAGAAGTEPATPLQIGPEFEIESFQEDLTWQAVWVVSSAKAGSGVKCLVDESPDTFWQSDNGQQHHICAYFSERMSMEDVYIYLDYRADESYTPQKISIRVGDFPEDLRETNVVYLHEPAGWVRIPIVAVEDLKQSGLDSGAVAELVKRRSTVVDAFVLQIVILSNHLHGRDSHIRGVKVVGPAPAASDSFGAMFASSSALRLPVVR